MKCRNWGCSYTEQTEAHIYDNAQDRICDTCGWTRDPHSCTMGSDWVNTDPDKHWLAYCTDPTCLYKDNKSWEGYHVYDNAQDTICNTCGYERPEHVCAQGTNLVTTDPDSHWYPACTDPACIHKDDRVSEQAHGYDNGQDSICDACGAVRTVDPAPQPTPEENEKPAQSENISGVLIVAGKPGNKKITLQWNEIKGASSYTVYSSVCNGKAYKRIKTVTGTKYVVKNLNNKKEYKFYVKANGTNNTIASTTCHVAMSKDKRTNPKSIKLNFKRTSLKAGAEKTIKATVKKEKSGKKLLGHAAKVRYYSSDASVAKVNEKGKISAVSKGTAVIYAVTENGLFKTVSVTVK